VSAARAHVLVVSTLLGLVLGGSLLLAACFPAAYVHLVQEDLAGEWAQVFFVVAALLLSARLAGSPSPHRLFFGLLALACLYVAGEEISWGQRILDIQTPDFFERHNLQRETNIHNLLAGPGGRWTKPALQVALAAALVSWGFVYPLTLRRPWRPAGWLAGKGVAAPPLYLWPFFVSAAFLELAPFNLKESELAELIIGFGLCLVALHYCLLPREPAQQPQGRDAAAARKMAAGAVAVLVAAGGASLAVTSRSWASPQRRENLDSRLLDGYRKLAALYQEHGRWDHVATLYLRMNDLEPSDGPTLRALARSFAIRKDEENFARFNRMALEADLERFRDDPEDVRLNISLARTYRQAGDQPSARHHLDMALTNALREVEERPDSASAAFWLGRTHALRGEPGEAVEQYRRAVRLDPRSRKYRRVLAEMESPARREPAGEGDERE